MPGQVRRETGQINAVGGDIRSITVFVKVLVAILSTVAILIYAIIRNFLQKLDVDQF